MGPLGPGDSCWPAGSWPGPSADGLGDAELFESKGYKPFANVNTNDCRKRLVLQERLRVLGVLGVIFQQGAVPGGGGNEDDEMTATFLMVAPMALSSVALD